jgi:two-component system NtrC family sensor kinase
MPLIPLKNRILVSMFAIIAAISVSVAILGYYVIKADIMDSAQKKVRNNLKAAQSFYLGEIERIETAFSLVDLNEDIASLRGKMKLHYLKSAAGADIENVPSEIVQASLESRHGVGGTRIMTDTELLAIDTSLVDSTRIQIKATPMALPMDKRQLEAVMVKEYAMPILDNEGCIVKVFYGGRIINRDYELVDKIRLMVFGSEQYHSKPVGTVTIFQGDTRISTNVLDENGQRAIGTRVSAQVYKEVIEKGNVWNDRAFVVNAWYKTAYEPIRNISGDIIGILYVGTLAEPFDVMARHITMAFIVIVAAGATLALVLSAKLNQREQILKVTNDKLAEANKSYVDLIGFVSHELKGILASTVMNAYAVRDGILGMVNFKQRKALDSITRNLDYLEATVRKFLNLGRIEKGELAVNKTELNLKKDVFDVSVESLKTLAVRKYISIDNEIDENLRVIADHDLMLVVANNLISNAIKYGKDNGRICIKCIANAKSVQVEVYNDSTPISEEQKEKLFKKFSRIETAETKRVKGTGLGLFITKQIIEKHAGRIWVEPREKGNSFIFQIERN